MESPSNPKAGFDLLATLISATRAYDKISTLYFLPVLFALITKSRSNLPYLPSIVSARISALLQAYTASRRPPDHGVCMELGFRAPGSKHGYASKNSRRNRICEDAPSAKNRMRLFTVTVQVF